MADTETTPAPTDEIDDIINPPTADVTTATDEADNITMTKAEVERLQRAADEADQLRADVDGLRQQVYAAQQPAPQPPQPGELTGETLFADPRAAIRGEVAATVTPMAQQFAAQLASMAVQAFRGQKAGDPLSSGVFPLFDKKIKQINPTFLGSLQGDNLNSTLGEAWNASVGEYVMAERGKRKPAKATNIGGGEGGGAAAPRTLEQIDRGAYNMAVANGWTAEQMDELAKELNEAKEE